MTRDQLIEALINRRMDAIYEEGSPDLYLRELFATGPQGVYDGYENMDDEDLIEEWNLNSDEEERIDDLESTD
jgi:hypothetical protein